METTVNGRTPAQYSIGGSIGALTRERNKALREADRYRRYDNGDEDAKRFEARAAELNRQIETLRERHNAA